MDTRLGNEEFVLGTPAYMSPEQAMGKETLDYRSDIYSLGATLYHIITGTSPYQGSESMIIRQHIKAAIPSPRAIDPKLPDDICFIIEKMMAKSPEDRYGSYEELKQDLTLVKQGNRPKLERLDSSKSTIARLEDFAGYNIKKIYQMEKQIQKLRTWEYVYQSIIAMLCILLIILLLFRK
jgi:serine/threonine-protein kinase